jgi:hypothetical protein
MKHRQIVVVERRLTQIAADDPVLSLSLLAHGPRQPTSQLKTTEYGKYKHPIFAIPPIKEPGLAMPSGHGTIEI